MLTEDRCPSLTLVRRMSIYISKVVSYSTLEQLEPPRLQVPGKGFVSKTHSLEQLTREPRTTVTLTRLR